MPSKGRGRSPKKKRKEVFGIGPRRQRRERIPYQREPVEVDPVEEESDETAHSCD